MPRPHFSPGSPLAVNALPRVDDPGWTSSPRRGAPDRCGGSPASAHGVGGDAATASVPGFASNGVEHLLLGGAESGTLRPGRVGWLGPPFD